MAPPKVFLKLGAWHMYRGINPLHSSELGNTVGELAGAHDLKSLHILILGVKGEQLRVTGIDRPFKPAPVDLAGDKDSDFLFLKPFFDHQEEAMSTLYDLRPFRAGFSKLGSIDPETGRLLFGLDFLILIRDPRASHTVSAPAE